MSIIATSLLGRIARGTYTKVMGRHEVNQVISIEGEIVAVTGTEQILLHVLSEDGTVVMLHSRTAMVLPRDHQEALR